MMNCDGRHRGGWYHNGSETRRFSDMLLCQNPAFYGLRSSLLKLHIAHDGELRQAGLTRSEWLGPFRDSHTTAAHTVRRTPVFPVPLPSPIELECISF